MVLLAAAEVQLLLRQEAEADTDSGTTGTCFLKEVHLPVRPGRPHAPPPPPIVATGTAATKGTNAGEDSIFASSSHLELLAFLNVQFYFIF